MKSTNTLIFSPKIFLNIVAFLKIFKINKYISILTRYSIVYYVPGRTMRVIA